MGRTRSMLSSAGTVGLINPRPEEPPDPALEALTRSGLTPAQAYQAQVYSNSPVAAQRHSAYTRPPSSEFRSSMNGGVSTPPRLGANIITDGGGLGIDFSGGPLSGKDSDDEDSELPWARRDSIGALALTYI